VIPAGSIGSNGHIEILTYWNYTANTNVKTVKVKLNTQAYLNQGTSNGTQAAALYDTFIWAANSTTAQVGASVPTFGTGSAANQITSSVNMSTAPSINFTALPTNTGDTITLMSYSVIAYR
jgi:hypothetical protein